MTPSRSSRGHALGRGLATSLLLTTLATSLAAQAPAPTAAPATPPASGPASTEELAARVRILERKLELADEAAAEKAKSTPATTAGADGFAWKSADGAYQLRVRGLLQVDGRFFPADDTLPLTDTLLIRRARPIMEGTLGKIVDFRLMPDFGGGATTLQDAWLDLRLSPSFKLRAGKAKVPVGLEALLEDKDLPFVERGLPSALAPVRDVGLQALGEPWGGKVTWAAGVFNGVADGASGDLDRSGAQDVAARLLWRPFQQPAGAAPSPVSFALGLAASRGDEEGTVANPALPSYRSAGVNSIFGYRSDGTAAGTVVAAGLRRRLAPQAYLAFGPLFALAEWTESRQEVARGVARSELSHRSWQLSCSWAITGEPLGERGVNPRHPFEPAGPGRGAFLLSLRYGVLELDPASFPLFADPGRSARRAENAGIAFGWILHRAVRLTLDYQQTTFDGGAAHGDRETEKALLTRVQVAF